VPLVDTPTWLTRNDRTHHRCSIRIHKQHFFDFIRTDAVHSAPTCWNLSMMRNILYMPTLFASFLSMVLTNLSY
jgi:hypothetical protein